MSGANKEVLNSQQEQLNAIKKNLEDKQSQLSAFTNELKSEKEFLTKQIQQMIKLIGELLKQKAFYEGHKCEECKKCECPPQTPCEECKECKDCPDNSKIISQLQTQIITLTKCCDESKKTKDDCCDDLKKYKNEMKETIDTINGISKLIMEIYNYKIDVFDKTVDNLTSTSYCDDMNTIIASLLNDTSLGALSGSNNDVNKITGVMQTLLDAHKCTKVTSINSQIRTKINKIPAATIPTVAIPTATMDIEEINISTTPLPKVSATMETIEIDKITVPPACAFQMSIEVVIGYLNNLYIQYNPNNPNAEKVRTVLIEQGMCLIQKIRLWISKLSPGMTNIKTAVQYGEKEYSWGDGDKKASLKQIINDMLNIKGFLEYASDEKIYEKLQCKNENCPSLVVQIFGVSPSISGVISDSFIIKPSDESIKEDSTLIQQDQPGKNDKPIIGENIMELDSDNKEDKPPISPPENKQPVKLEIDENELERLLRCPDKNFPIKCDDGTCVPEWEHSPEKGKDGFCGEKNKEAIFKSNKEFYKKYKGTDGFVLQTKDYQKGGTIDNKKRRYNKWRI